MTASRFLAGSLALMFAVPTLASIGDTASSPDGRLRATIRADRGEAGASGEPASALWITDTRTGGVRPLLRSRPSADPRHNLSSMARPRFSLDGGYVYVEADAYATSPAIHQVSVRTGRERFVADGALLGVLRTGAWRGWLVVAQHRYRAGGGSYEAVSVCRPDGRVMGTVPGGEDGVARWLRAKGWRMS